MVIKSLKEILLTIKRDIFLQKEGLNLSKKIGDGFDFAELNHYTLGEDAKKIDWKATAKTQIPHIKRYNQEKSLEVSIVVLLTKSMLFGNKMDLLIKSTQTLAYEIVKSNNKLTPMILNGNNLIKFPPSKSSNLIKHFIESIKKEPIQKFDIDIKSLYKHIKPKSLTILIGDFLDIYDLSTISKKSEVFVIIVRDEFEKNPKILKERDFKSLTSEKKASFFFGKKELKEWREGYEKSDQALIKELNRLKIGYTTL